MSKFPQPSKLSSEDEGFIAALVKRHGNGSVGGLPSKTKGNDLSAEFAPAPPPSSAPSTVRRRENAPSGYTNGDEYSDTKRSPQSAAAFSVPLRSNQNQQSDSSPRTKRIRELLDVVRNDPDALYAVQPRTKSKDRRASVRKYPVAAQQSNGRSYAAGTNGDGTHADEALVTKNEGVMENVTSSIRNCHQMMVRQPAPPAAPNEEAELQNLRTGEDAVMFFSRHGQRATVKYVYANRDPAATGYRPYDLAVVRRGAEESEHFVISSTGVVHVRPGQPSDVFSVAQWVRESSVFNILRRIRLFRTYLAYKALTKWHRKIRMRNFLALRQQLSRSCFLAKRTFAAPVMELLKATHDLRTARQVHYEPQGRHDYTIPDFSVSQDNQIRESSSAFSVITERIEKRLESTVETVERRADVPDFNSMLLLEQYLVSVPSNGRGSGAAVGAGANAANNAKTKSMIAARQDEWRQKRELKQAMVEFSSIGSFVRLVEYMITESVYQNSLSSIVELYDTIRHQQNSTIVKSIAFQILLKQHLLTLPGDYANQGEKQEEEDLTFSPAEPEISGAFKNLLHGITRSINDIPRIISKRAFKTHFSSAPCVWSIGETFGSDARVTLLRQLLLSVIHSDYEAAGEKMLAYKATLPTLHFISYEWKQTKAEWEVRSIGVGMKSTDIAAMYNRLHQANDSLRVLMTSFVGHLLWINAGKLKMELEPQMRTIREELDNILRLTAHTRTTNLHSYFKERIQQLSERPATLHEFVAFMQNLNAINQQLSGTELEVAEAETLYELMERHQVEITDDDERQLRERTIGSSRSTVSVHVIFDDALTQAEQFVVENKEQHVTELSNEALRIEEECSALQGVLLGDEFALLTDDTAPVMQYLSEIQIKLDDISSAKENLSNYAALFRVEPISWNFVDELFVLYDARQELWSILDEFQRQNSYWFECPLKELDTKAMEESLRGMVRKTVASQRLVAEKGYRDEIAPYLMNEIQDLQQNMTVIHDCGNSHLGEKHWAHILEVVTGGAIQYQSDLNLGVLDEYNIYEFKDLVAEESGMATGEWRILNELEELKHTWDTTQFVTKEYKQSADVFILGEIEDIIQLLDDNQLQLQTITASRFVAAARHVVDSWLADLRIISDVMEEWVALQKNWMYLEFIFSSDDIKEQLPEESVQFNKIDSFFKGLTSKARTVGNVFSICTKDGVLDQLRESNEAIDLIQKKLEEYLETKRVAFPRFYFLSNDELLAILSDVRNPRAVQPHLTKCFDSIAALTFGDEQATKIIGMRSAEGEVVEFVDIVYPVGSVEAWLQQIEAAMKKSLLVRMRETVAGFSQARRAEWLFEHPAQCVQTVDMILWTNDAETSMTARSLTTYYKEYQNQIFEMVELIKTPLTPLNRTLVCTLIVVDVHNRDVVQAVSDARVESTSDFEWVKQLRFYWETEQGGSGKQNVGIRHGNATLLYGYEYLGNQPRLVITPLTDRAFLTCTSALAMNLGAAPQGPAGTGKTESVKDLGKALARQVVVFNCSDGINYRTMSRMFAGLAQAGAWACFDEFNRIELEVLSVVAQQMLDITTALSHKREQMAFDGRTIALSKNFGVFITMNPGYAGRTELPDNLKALFRPVCMMIPDYALIAEIMFYSEGFANAKTLAHKMVQLYKFSSEQLSKQDHYDFGMRAVKSILVMAGSLKRASPDEDEDMLLIRAMRDSNVPKFLRDDTILFMALVRDLFPTVTINDKPNITLDTCIVNEMKQANLKAVDGIVAKIKQLYDTLVVRHGVMMVGQTFCAKTTIVKTLQKSLITLKEQSGNDPSPIPLHNKVHTHWLNPKAVSMGELYGQVNEITREWKDGILSYIARSITQDAHTSQDRQWVVFDGPVDAVWIENMNTVLDDNRMLCLFNGERIKLPSTATFMFEVQDLRVASPATVSRCGMVFVEPYYLDGGRGWVPIVQSLVAEKEKQCAKFNAARVLAHLEKVLPSTLEFVRTNCKEWIPSVDAQLAVSCVELLFAFMKNVEDDVDFLDVDAVADNEGVDGSRTRGSVSEGRNSTTTPAAGGGPTAPSSRRQSYAAKIKDPGVPMLREFVRPTVAYPPVTANDTVLLDMYFVMAFAWSVGGNLADDSRPIFSDFIKQPLRDVTGLEQLNDSALDASVSVYDYVVHRKSAKFVTWRHITPDFRYFSRTPFFDQFVPTAETTSLKCLLRVLTSSSRNVLVNGVTGTGKSAVMGDFLGNTLQGDNPEAAWEYFGTVFSAQTKSRDVEDRVESKLYKIRNTVLGPTPGKRAIFFVDDLSMPSLEKYGASPPLELLRQIITHGGFFDKRKQPAVFKEVRDVLMLAVCGVPGGGRSEVTKRLTSQFHLLCQPAVSTESTTRIFTSILNGFMSSWSDEIRSMAPQLVAATKECYDRICSEKRPTPDKSHYTFNLRDVSKVVQGIVQVSPRSVSDRGGFIRTFIHEVSRVFHDRLVNDEDRTWWWSMLQDVVQRQFDTAWRKEYESLTFGDFMQHNRATYEEIPRLEDVQRQLKEFQTNYNTESLKQMDLVVFSDAAHHIARICRICRQPRGNALLVGLGGSGRQSLCRLAAYICGMAFSEISVRRSYGLTEFRDDFKVILLESGCNAKPTVFYLSDSQIVEEAMLEDLDSVLNTGEVPNMMQPEDIDSIVEAVRPLASEAGKQETRNVIYSHFISLCRENVHIVIGMSPIGEQFRRRLRMFPSLVNCCTIDWFDRWPVDALIGVAARAIEKSPYVEEAYRGAVANMCVFIHQDVQEQSGAFYEELRRHNYTTPTSYLALIDAYQRMLQEQHSLINGNIVRYQGGLDKLQSTQTLVDEMKAQLVSMQPKLVQSAKDTEEIMVKVEKQQGEAEVIRRECAAEEEVAGGIRKEADAIRADCQSELDKALPILQAAEDALKDLRPDDIREVKSFQKPASRVVLVMEAVLLLLGEKDNGWDRAKVVMGRLDFIRDLQTYKKDDLSEKMVRQLQKYITNPEFQPDEVAKSSKACRSLALWVLAINNYYDVVKVVGPKRQHLAEAESRLQAANQALESAQGKLREIEGRVSLLRKEMEENISKKKVLEADIELTTKRLGRAEQLMNGLSSEQERWVDAVRSLGKDKAMLVGTMLLAAGCIAYLGPFTAPYREKMIEGWTRRCKELKIPVKSSGFELSSVVDQGTVRHWWSLGLPQDSFSVENAIISTKANRWSLCIDPQGQALAWIRAMERDNNLRVIKLSDSNYMRVLENAIKIGLPVLLENVGERIDAALDPVLLKQTYRSQGRLLLKLGDTEVDYDPAFRLYITSKMPNPHFLPELQIKVTMVNFSVTQMGLENQLLADVVRYEYAELEVRADKTVSDIESGRAQLKGLEERILQLLASSTGNILDNEALIAALGDAKLTSESVSEALRVAENTQKEIEQARNRYRPVATRGALTFSVVSEVANIDHMYQISLDFFKKLFLDTLRRTKSADDVDERVALLIPAVTLDSYNTICRGLFDKDRLLFAFLLFTHIYRASGTINGGEWVFFLKGSEGKRIVDAETDLWPQWLNESAWNELTALSHAVPVFRDIKNEMYKNESAWKTWFEQDQLLSSNLPAFLSEVPPWQKLLVIKAVKEDLVISTMRQVVGHYIGSTFTESPPFDLEGCFADSSPTAPVIFVLSPGTDPTALFTEFAEKKGFGERKHMLSLGQDQGPKAETMISDAANRGMWVYLQNCHVYGSWMPVLERILDGLRGQTLHNDFRLWLTTMPAQTFPSAVLQRGIKIVNEPAKGLKANLRNNFAVEVSKELWDSHPQNGPTWKRLLCSLSYFHAVIQERRKFGALGWNIPYEWNQSDFAASIKTLDSYFSDNSDGVPWSALRYLIGVINYGGRVTDFLDSRALTSILSGFLNETVVTPNQQWNLSKDGVYHIPENVDELSTIQDYLKQLPSYESPELFGLHGNAEVTFNRQTARRQLATILSVQPRAKAEMGLSPEEKVLETASEFERRLPEPIDVAKAHPSTYRVMEDGSIFSLGTVVSQEIEFFNGILARVRKSLVELQRAIKGEVVMSAELEAMFDSFIVGQVPHVWHANGYLSLKPLASWFEDTLKRVEFFREWNNEGEPTSYWLSGFFFPQGFLTGVLQAHSRRYGIPIDDVVFKTNMTDYTNLEDVDEPPETGVYVHGLFMEGARFDERGMTLRESRKGELFTSVPVIWLEPVQRSTLVSAAAGGPKTATEEPGTKAVVQTYSCPVYKTSSRAGALSTTGLSTNFVLSLDIPTTEEESKHWILRGVALLCMLDD